MKTLIKRVIGAVNRPLLKVLLPRLPFGAHAYLAGIGHGRDRRHRLAYAIGKVVTVNNLKEVRRSLSERLEQMPLHRRRKHACMVWQAASVTPWAQRAYENTPERSSFYPYQTAKTLHRLLGQPLRILELGTMNGGSLKCLEYLGVEVERFVGVDIAKEMIELACREFPNSGKHEFVAADFMEFCNSTQERFDLLILKQTAFFLDQPYIENLFGLLASP